VYEQRDAESDSEPLMKIEARDVFGISDCKPEKEQRVEHEVELGPSRKASTTPD
jgi:hypothetical protein